jgi:hypothetical protein
VGVDVEAGIELTNRAAMAIRAADPSGRPLTASVAEMYAQTDPWAKFYEISALDFIQVHSYSEQLDRMLISMVRRNLDRYNKPVLIGESGLYAYPHVRTENAHRGIEHAIWAGTVSGAMNGRALWDEDGYSIYSRDRNDAFQFMEQYAAAELPAARFVQGVDFARYKPLPAEFSGAITGATVGTESSAIGWFRDATCEPPNWRVDFYDTKSGMPLNKTITVARQGERVPVPLPDFSDDIAFKMVAVPAGQ